jgi:hypothetical protein
MHMDITFLKSLYASIYLFFSYYGLHTVQAFFLCSFGVAKYAIAKNNLVISIHTCDFRYFL